MSYCRKCGYRYHPNSDADECSNCGRQRYDDPCPDCAALRQQLAAAQAQNTKLRDAAQKAAEYMDQPPTDFTGMRHNGEYWDALDALNTALQEAQQ